jgi:hypothetical protein
MRIVRPTSEGDDIAAMREALLRPKVVGEFLRMYDGGALPPEAIATNVLKEKGVPADRADGVLELIVEGAQAVGFLKEWGGKRYVDLTGSTATTGQDDAEVRPADVPQNDSVPVPPQRDPSEATRSAAGTAGGVSVAPGVHINIEIHIAADASSETIEEIFRNMRRYVLTGDGQADDVHQTR